MWRVEMYVRRRVELGELAPRSEQTTRAVLRQWHHHAGPITNWTTEQAFGWVHDQSVRPNTRRNRLNKLRPYVRWLLAEGHLPVDILAGVPKVRVPSPIPRDLEADAVSRVLAVCADDRARLAVLLMVHCGLRCVDLSRALLEDVDPQRRLLKVRAKGGRGEVTHQVPIPSEAWDALVGLLNIRRSGPIIASLRRNQPTAVTAGCLSKMIGRLVRDAGLKAFPYDGVSAHALRHSCAQQMLDLGAPLRAVQWALGHKHSSTTEMYLRREPPGLREAMEGRRYAA